MNTVSSGGRELAQYSLSVLAALGIPSRRRALAYVRTVWFLFSIGSLGLSVDEGPNLIFDLGLCSSRRSALVCGED